MNRSALLAAGVAFLLAFAPAGAWAAPQPGETVVKFRGQDVYVKGNPAVKYLPAGSDGSTPDAELVLSYTNYADSVINALRLEQKFEARVLVVGGGGAGGYGTTNANDTGGGGGGGEVIELGNKGRGRGNSAPFQFSRNSLTEDEISDIPKREEKQMNLLRVIILMVWLRFHRPTTLDI